jgi:hypothetical protein
VGAARRAIDEVHADLTGTGYPGRHPPYHAFWAARHAIVEDPEGNPVALMSPVDAELRHWPPAPPSRDVTARLYRQASLTRTSKPKVTNYSHRSVTSSSAAARQFLGAEQRDEHNGGEQPNGHQQHLPGAVKKVSHNARPVLRARDVLPGRAYTAPQGAG